VHQVSWLEEHIEALRFQDSVILSAIARDSMGRTFTNCSNVNFKYEIKGDGVSKVETTHANWEWLQEYVHQEAVTNSILLKRRFDLEPIKTF